MHFRGFTLIEVLLSLTIVAIALASGLRASGVQVNATIRRDHLFLAKICAENELIKIRLEKQFPALGENSFLCSQAGFTLKGTLRVFPTPNPNIRKIESLIFAPTAPSDERYVILRLSTIKGLF
jgi:general secretion pathway protein I